MASSNPKVAFLVVCWNNREIISECLEAIDSQTYENKVVYLIDNNSSDGSAEHIRKNHPAVHLIDSDKNNGFARGNNILIREAQKDPAVKYVALVNSDAMIDKNWTKELISYIAGKRHVAAAQGVTLDYYDRSVIDADHIYVRPNLQSVQHGYLERFSEATAYPRRVFGVNAAAAIYSRKFIEAQPQKDFFDEKFFMYLEDVDVSFRALVMGWDSYFIPSARAYHMGSVSAKKRSSTFNINMSVRNQAALIFKNMPFTTFIHLFVGALRFEKHFYAYLKKTHGKESARAALRSRWVGIARLPLYIVDRYRVQRVRKRSPRDLERIMSNEGII